jgi:hypothetical protein
VLRVPLLAGTRLVLANAPDDAVVLRPPPPARAVADVGAAVRDALRFPLEGDGLEPLARRGGRATIVVESPALPIPGSPNDPRQQAISAVVAELERHGISTGYQTLLVAPGLARRPSQRSLETFVTPELARRFHGHVVVHDVEDPELVRLDDGSRPPLRVNRALVETDLVVVVSAAESVLHGGPAALLAAAGADALRAAGAYSLLETTASQGWHLALALERALGRHVGRTARLPVRSRRARPHRTVPAASCLRCAAGGAPARPSALSAHGADGGGCVRRPAVGRARGGAPAGGSAAKRHARRAARRARDRDPGRDAVSAA